MAMVMTVSHDHDTEYLLLELGSYASERWRACQLFNKQALFEHWFCLGDPFRWESTFSGITPLSVNN